MEQVLIPATTGASAIGYAYLAEIPQQQLRARTAGWGLAISNLFHHVLLLYPSEYVVRLFLRLI